MGSMFSEWVNGQPWWLTLLLLPALVLAAAVAKLVRDAVILIGAGLALAAILAAWEWLRRR